MDCASALIGGGKSPLQIRLVLLEGLERKDNFLEKEVG